MVRKHTEWFGNTQKVVADHYLRSDPESLKRATQQPEETNELSTAVEIGDLFRDLNTPEPSESDGTERNSKLADTNRKPMIFRPANKKPYRITRGQMLPQGLGPSRKKTGKTAIGELRGPIRGPRWEELRQLIAICPDLSFDSKRKITVIGYSEFH